MFFKRIVIFLVVCWKEFSQAQQYILDPQLHFRPQDDYYNQNKQIQFQQHFPGFSSFDPYLPQRDLQTSDVPVHLQKTLPQYRFTSKEQLAKNELPYRNTLLFRPDHERVPQNVIPSTHRPNYSHFLSKNHHINPSETETFLGQVTLDNSFGSLDNFYKSHEERQSNSEGTKVIPPKLLRQHTRILAPDPEDKQNQLQENKYFVNENGEVFSTTVTAPSKILPPRRLSTKLEVEDENVNSREYPRNNIINYDKPSYFTNSDDQDFNSANNFDLKDYDFAEDAKISTTIKAIRSSTYKPTTVSGEYYDTKDIRQRLNKSLDLVDEINHTIHNVSEPVVSVVTTKSVINNTIIATQMPPVTSESSTQSMIENSTDSWVVVASVQTSKSISGAHYLPSSVVAQEERFTLLNEKSHKQLSEEETSTEEFSSYEEEYENESSTPEVTTTSPIKHSTESLIDKLDRVQSDLSSGLLTGGYKNEDNNIAVITENMTDTIPIADITESPTEASQLFPSIAKSNTPVIKKFSSRARPPTSNLYPKRKPQIPKKAITTQRSIPIPQETSFSKEPRIIVTKPDAFLPPGYKAPSENENSSDLVAELLRKFKESTEKTKEDNELNPLKATSNSSSNDTSPHRFSSSHVSTTKPPKVIDNSSHSSIDSILKKAKTVDIKNFLPPGYTSKPKPSSSNATDTSSSQNEDNSHNSPPIKKSDSKKSSTSLIDELLNKTKKDDISAFLPPGFKLPSSSTNKPNLEGNFNKAKQDDTSAFLPPGFKVHETSTTKKPTRIDEILENSKEDDISAFLPAGYKAKLTSSTQKSLIDDILDKSKKDDISAFLPPGFKPKFTTRKPVSKGVIETEDLPTSLLPTGYKPRKNVVLKNDKMIASTEKSMTQSMVVTTETTTSKGGLKVVFPSRPGGKRINHKLTTPKSKEERKEVTQAPVPTIHKGWPSRATTEFTGWPTPSTTPISIEKLLESVQRASPTSAEPENVTSFTSTQTTVTSTTTTSKPTTPGVCEEECDLVGTIKLVDGVKWVPELLDRNTKEWQILANEVQSQLEEVYSKSGTLKTLFRNLRIDGFSEGSVLVDYLVEMQNSEMHVSTSQMKKLFNEALESTLVKSTPREGKSLNDTVKYVEKAKLGKFIIDPTYTDFIVVPKQIAPTVGYAEDDLLLPQWAIAVIVIGLASLLFVIIFGVTVLVNRSKNAKKKVPTPLTDDMLNELNKNHMGGYDNYAIEDPYSIEAGFWDPRRMDAHREYNKLPKKGSSGSIHDNSMTNLYDSWNSQNNGFYNNSAGSYYGHHTGASSSHRLYERRRSYDTNF